MEKLKNFLFRNTSDKQIFFKNSFWLFISEFLGRLLRMALLVYAARALGAEGWGTFNYALSVGALIMIFSDAGIGNLITRETAEKKEGYTGVVSSAIILKNILLLISTVLVVVVGPYISHIKNIEVLFALIAIVFLFDALRELAFSINRAYEKMEREMVIKTLTSLLTFIAGIFILKTSPRPESLAIANIIASFIGLIMIVAVIWQESRSLLQVNLSNFKKVIYVAVPFAATGALMTILGNIDVYMLGIYRTSAEIGLYSGAQRILQFILVIPAIIAITSFPIMSRIGTLNQDRMKELVEKILALLLIISLPIVLGGLVFAREIISLIFGEAYLGGVTVFSLLIPTIIFSFPVAILTNLIFINNNQKRLVPIYIVGVITGVVCNILLVPRFGATGTAAAYAISNFLISFMIYVEAKKQTDFSVFSYFRKMIQIR